MDIIAEIEQTRPAFIAWTNTDCTEGRGQQIPKAISFSKSCAIRLGRKGSVQGSDCNVTEGIAVKLLGSAAWLATAHIHHPTREDDAADDVLRKKEDAARRKKEALERAKAAGLSADDIQALKGDL